MIYYLTEGSYSDYSVCSIWEGPDGLKIEGLEAMYAHTSPEELERYNHGPLVEGGSSASTLYIVRDKFDAFLETLGLRKLEACELSFNGRVGQVTSKTVSIPVSTLTPNAELLKLIREQRDGLEQRKAPA